MKKETGDISRKRLLWTSRIVLVLMGAWMDSLMGCEAVLPLNGHVCGNHICEPGEDCEQCPEDCGYCITELKDYFLDGRCTLPMENAVNDPEECFCGNGSCDIDENCETCAQDCGDCQYSGGAANGQCETASGETRQTSPRDCGCGDGTCNAWYFENCLTCPEDCGSCYCTDGALSATCNDNDSAAACPQICGCGDGICSFYEVLTGLCPQDCPCNHDGRCTGGETAFTCHSDCGSGDGVCDIYESPETDGGDCVCSLDGLCTQGRENTWTCFQDCK